MAGSNVISVELFQFRGFALEPSDISLGDGESLDVAINSNGRLTKFQITQPTITFTVKGALASDVQTFDAERSNNIRSLINRTAVGEDIPISGKTITNALLLKVTPSAPIKVGGVEIIESMQLEFRSFDYQ
ncbi:MAG TPA: hypothetical protein V6D07_19040 [Trichocoleus sp.]